MGFYCNLFTIYLAISVTAFWDLNVRHFYKEYINVSKLLLKNEYYFSRNQCWAIFEDAMKYSAIIGKVWWQNWKHTNDNSDCFFRRNFYIFVPFGSGNLLSTRWSAWTFSLPLSVRERVISKSFYSIDVSNFVRVLTAEMTGGRPPLDKRALFESTWCCFAPTVWW